MNKTAILARLTGRCKTSNFERFLISIISNTRIFDAHRAIIEIGDLVIAEAIDMNLVQPVMVDRLDIVAGKLFLIVDFGPKWTISARHGALYACIPIDHMIGKARINMLIDHI